VWLVDSSYTNVFVSASIEIQTSMTSWASHWRPCLPTAVN